MSVSSFVNNSLAMTRLNEQEGTALRVAPLKAGQMLADMDQSHSRSYASENTQAGGVALRENYEVAGGVHQMFNPYENPALTCQTASVQGGRTSGPMLSNYSQCPPAVSIRGMAQQPSALDLIAWDTESRQSRAKFAERDLFVRAVPNDGTFGTRLEGSGPVHDVDGCHMNASSANPNGSFCGLTDALALPELANVPDFFSDALVAAPMRAVSAGRVMGAGCFINAGSTSAAVCALDA